MICRSDNKNHNSGDILSQTRSLNFPLMSDPFESALPSSPYPSHAASDTLHLSITSAIVGICFLYYVAVTLYTKSGSKVLQPFINLFRRKSEAVSSSAKVHNADEVGTNLGPRAGGDGDCADGGDPCYDAVVVGAGVAGSALAYSLGKVRIRSTTRTNLPRTRCTQIHRP